MAGSASDWVDNATLKFELDVADHDAKAIAALDRYIGSAVNLVEQYTGLPLLDRNYPVYLTPNGTKPILIGRCLYAYAVANAEYWTEIPDPGVLPTNTVPGDMPTIVAANTSDPTGYYYIVPPSGGWPSDAVRLQITITCGMQPIDHQVIVQSIILACRDFAEGKAQLNTIAFEATWTILLQNVGYWNAPSAIGSPSGVRA